MTRPSRAMTVSAALALALLPAGYAASSAFADSAAAPTAPAFTLTHTASGFDVSVPGTGATVSFTVSPTGAVEAADSDANESEVDLTDSTAGDNNEQEGDNNDEQGSEDQSGADEKDGDNADDEGDNADDEGDNADDEGDNADDPDGPDDQSGDQQGPNDESADQGSND